PMMTRCSPPPGLEPALGAYAGGASWGGAPGLHQPLKVNTDHAFDHLPQKIMLGSARSVGGGLSEGVAQAAMALAFKNQAEMQKALLMKHMEQQKLMEKMIQAQLLQQIRIQGVQGPAPVVKMHPGTMVCLKGLRITPELNGQYAMVEGWDAANYHWKIRMLNGEEKFAKTENLAVVQVPMAPTCPLPPGLLQLNSDLQHPNKLASSDLTSPSTTASNSVPPSLCRSRSDSLCDATSENMSEPAVAGSSEMTTVMMRNIPSDYTGLMLLKLLDKNGFNGSYDLVYLPMDYNNCVGFGYAFINFVSSQAASGFRQAFEGFTDWGLASDKVCEVCWSSVLQGLEAHIERYHNSPVMHEAVPDAFKPLLFAGGQRIPFPAPTKNIRPPRLRKKAIKL
ncbi:unnamed protein product, partial [Polarella glacialis]